MYSISCHLDSRIARHLVVLEAEVAKLAEPVVERYPQITRSSGVIPIIFVIESGSVGFITTLKRAM